MAKKESSFKNMLVTLLSISVIAGFALGGVYNITKEPIEIAKKAKAEAAIKAVIPEFDSLRFYKVVVENGPDSLLINQGFKDGILVGTAIETFSKGYSPEPIRIMVGFSTNGEIINTAIIEQKETPGLGSKMTGDKFKNQFNGKNPSQFTLKVKKDGGSVDAITAATISSRAFCDAVQKAHSTYLKDGGSK